MDWEWEFGLKVGGDCQATADLLNIVLRDFMFHGSVATLACDTNGFLSAKTTNSCVAITDLLNTAMDAFEADQLTNCDFTTVTTSATSTATSTVTTTVTTQERIEPFECMANSTVLSMMVSEVENTCNYNVQAMNGLLGLCSADRPESSGDDASNGNAAELPVGQTGNFTCALGLDAEGSGDGGDGVVFYIRPANNCELHAQMLTSVIQRMYTVPDTTAICVDGAIGFAVEAGAPDSCEMFQLPLAGALGRYFADPSSPELDGCNTAPIITTIAAVDAPETYRFVFVQDEQLAGFQASVSGTGYYVSLEEQLTTALDVRRCGRPGCSEAARRRAGRSFGNGGDYSGRLAVVSVDADATVTVNITARAESSGLLATDIAADLDAIVRNMTSPFTFTYGARSLTSTSFVSTTPTPEVSSSASSDDEGTSIIAAVVVVAIVLCMAVVYLFVVFSRRSAAAKDAAIKVGQDDRPSWADDLDAEDNTNGSVTFALTRRASLNARRTSNLVPDVPTDQPYAGRRSSFVPETSSAMAFKSPFANSGAMALPDQTAFQTSNGYDYGIHNSGRVEPFSFTTTFPIKDLQFRTPAVNRREVVEVVRVTQSFQATAAGHHVIDDYKHRGGLIAARDELPWAEVWAGMCTTIVILPAENENLVVFPGAGNSTTSGTFVVKNTQEEKYENIRCVSLEVSSTLTGETRHMRLFQPQERWESTTMLKNTVDLLMASMDSHFVVESGEVSNMFLYETPSNGRKPQERPSMGAFLLAWVSMKSASDTGMLDLARVMYILCAQDKALLTDADEYEFVVNLLAHVLVQIPAMNANGHQLSTSQKHAIGCLQNWRTVAIKHAANNDNGYRDIMPDGLAGEEGSGYLALEPDETEGGNPIAAGAAWRIATRPEEKPEQFDQFADDDELSVKAPSYLEPAASGDVTAPVSETPKQKKRRQKSEKKQAKDDAKSKAKADKAAAAAATASAAALPPVSEPDRVENADPGVASRPGGFVWPNAWWAEEMGTAEVSAAVDGAGDGAFMFRKSSKPATVVLVVNGSGSVSQFQVQKTKLGWDHAGRNYSTLVALVASLRAEGVVSSTGETFKIKSPAPGGSLYPAEGVGQLIGSEDAGGIYAEPALVESEYAAAVPESFGGFDDVVAPEAFPGFSGDGGEQRVDDESDDDSGAPPKTRGDALLETGDRHGVFASEPVPSQVQLPGSTLDTPVFDPRDHVVDDRIEADNVDGRRSSVVPVEAPTASSGEALPKGADAWRAKFAATANLFTTSDH